MIIGFVTLGNVFNLSNCKSKIIYPLLNVFNLFQGLLLLSSRKTFFFSSFLDTALLDLSSKVHPKGKSFLQKQVKVNCLTETRCLRFSP